MEEARKILRVMIISDGTGETATSLSNAAITQFKYCDLFFTRYKNVRSIEQIESILLEASIHHDIVVHTVVQEELRNKIVEITKEKNINALDLIGPALNLFSIFLNQEPSSSISIKISAASSGSISVRILATSATGSSLIKESCILCSISDKVSAA